MLDQHSVAARPVSSANSTEAEISGSIPFTQYTESQRSPEAHVASTADEKLPFDKDYRPWNRGLKATTAEVAVHPNRPDGPALWVEPSGLNRSSKVNI